MSANITQTASRILQRLELGLTDPNELTLFKDDMKNLVSMLGASPPTISNNSSDFSTILLQLHERIKRQDTWKDFNVSSTGRTLLELMAAIGAFLQNSISVAFRESFYDTAVRSSSHYALARTLGCRVSRKTTPKAKTWLRRIGKSEVQTIPPFTQFVVGGLEFFNAEPFIFPQGEATLPINVVVDADGRATKKDDFIAQLYLGQVVFADTGQFYFPCTGIIEALDQDGLLIASGTVQITSDKSMPDSAFGVIYFSVDTILPASTKYEITLSQYNGTNISGSFKPLGSAMIKFPGSIPFQIKRTGVGSSVLTPAVGTANIPQHMAIITDEDYSVAKEKYRLPKYLNQSVVQYDSDVFLYSGRVQTKNHTVIGQIDFYSIAIEQAGFFVADEFMQVQVYDGNGVTTWAKAEKPIWEYSSEDRVFVDSTFGNGDAVLTFGNGIHGKALEANWVVSIKYVLTKGSIGNGIPAESPVSCPSFLLEGGTITATYGGSDEKPASYYKSIAPTKFRAKSRMVTKEDHEAFLLDLPNVADVAALRQKDLAPHDLRFMNRMTLVLLPASPLLRVYPDNSLMAGKLFDSSIINPKDPNEPNVFSFSDLERKDLELSVRKSSFSAIDLDLTRSPIPIPITIKIRAFCYRQFALDTVRSQISLQLKSLFDRKRGVLGRSLLLADIMNACKIAEIDYIEVLQPTFDVILGGTAKDLYSFVCLDQAPDIVVEYTARRI